MKSVDIVSSIRDVDTDSAAARLAVLHKQGVGENKAVEILSEEFKYKFTRSQLKKFEYKETYLRTIEEYQKKVVKKAVSELKHSTSRLVPKIVKAIEDALEKGNINAITHALKILGIESVEPEQKQAQSITVVLPGKQQTQEKDVGEK
jgi:hypothetical protein